MRSGPSGSRLLQTSFACRRRCVNYAVASHGGQSMIRALMIAAAVFAIAATGNVSAQTSAADKAAISKACSDQANAKGLHGKARKKFRAECKRRGGKPQ